MIEHCRGAYPVRMMCRLLSESPSGYYDAIGRPPSARALANERLLEQVRALHADSDGVWGSPRITDELRFRGETCGRGHRRWPTTWRATSRTTRRTVNG